MTDQQILDKATKKAIKAGWAPSEDVLSLVLSRKAFIIELAPVILFDKEFCKALWGEEEVSKEITGAGVRATGLDSPLYKIHLMAMVIAEDPIKYLERNM